jgi:hypothetical protein
MKNSPAPGGVFTIREDRCFSIKRSRGLHRCQLNQEPGNLCRLGRPCLPVPLKEWRPGINLEQNPTNSRINLQNSDHSVQFFFWASRKLDAFRNQLIVISPEIIGIKQQNNFGSLGIAVVSPPMRTSSPRQDSGAGRRFLESLIFYP